jgi:hypothetical protein
MVRSALPEVPLEEIDLLAIENVGNLVCPAGARPRAALTLRATPRGTRWFYTRSMAEGSSMEAIAREFIDAFNRRDAEGLVALCDAEIDFQPTPLVGAHDGYRGHDGLRRWVEDLGTSGLDHQVRVREVRVLDERRFLLLSEVWIDGELVSPSAMLARLTETGAIVEAQAFLSDEETLERIVLEPEEGG